VAKYRKRPVVVDAEVYHPGVEDGWVVHFSGNAFNYEKVFESKERAEKFVELNLGFIFMEDEDRKYDDIIYETPMPYIKTKEGKHEISEGDYIITGVVGERYPCKPDIFHMTYEEVGADDL